MNKNIFREYDIRGVYPIDLNEDIYFEIGNAIASKCKQLSIDSIVLGRDGRLSGKSLMNALENSLINNGINIENIGIVTSPLLYYAAKKHSSKSGIMVTGSHNPKEYNGIKITCSFPIKISFFNSFYDYISKIQIENEEIKLGTLSNNEIEEYLENIPYTLLKRIKNRLYKLNQPTINLFEIRSKDDTTNFSFNYKQEELFSLIKFSFTDSLKNLLYYEYICSSKLHIPPSDYLKMTPGETKIIIKHLTDEIKKQNEKQSQSSTPPPGLGHQPQ